MYSVSLGVLLLNFFLTFSDWLELECGTRSINFRKHSQALASTRKLTQIGAVTTITTGCTWKDLGLTLSLLFFRTLVTSFEYSTEVSSNTTLLEIFFEFYSVLPYSLSPMHVAFWIWGLNCRSDRIPVQARTGNTRKSRRTDGKSS